MSGSIRRRAPKIVMSEGKPTAVILDIDEYQGILERLEDLDDLSALEEMRKKPLRLRKLEGFLMEYSPSA